MAKRNVKSDGETSAPAPERVGQDLAPLPDSPNLTAGILDSVAVGVVRVCSRGQITYANAHARHLLGLIPAGIPGISLRDFEPYTILPNGDRFRYDDYPAIKCLQTGQPQPPTTLGLSLGGGDVSWVTITALPIIDPATGLANSAIATFVDISHSKQIEEALGQSEERYRRLVDDAPDAMVVHHRGTIVYVNDAAVRLWGGRSPDDFLGTHVMKLVHPDFHEAIKHRVERAASGETVPLFDHLNVRLDGSIVHVESTAMPCIYNGKPCVQAILRNVTQRKADQEALRRANDELERRVEQRTEELSRKNDELQSEISERRRAESQLQEKQRFLNRLLSVHERERQLVAYEMHDTFVQDVIGALMFIDAFYEVRREQGESGLEAVDQSRQLLRKAIEEARHMISGLRPPIIDEQGIEAAIEYLVNEAKRRGMEIHFEHTMRVHRLAPTLEAAIFRIVQEALTNAERHSQASHADVKLTQSASELRLEISDRGVGFDPGQVGEGHFGLEGMRERARTLGAELLIQSAPGQGSSIIMRLPLLIEESSNATFAE